MSRLSLLPMSQILASDAPLLSPTSPDSASAWDQRAEDVVTYDYDYYDDLSPSLAGSGPRTPNGANPAMATSKMMRMRPSPNNSRENVLCLPTHELFDIPPQSTAASECASPSSAHSSPRLPPCSIPITAPNPGSSKRGCSSSGSISKKARSSGERLKTSKEFVPPDVSGMSKREQRLVKNRAAAFLSRQRKREEFESMEVRVEELEEENARLRKLAGNGSVGHRHKSHAEENLKLLSEIEQLRAHLAEAEERERRLAAELARKGEEETLARENAMKVESDDKPSSLASSRFSPPYSSHRTSAASLGLMRSEQVLICALPTLISMSTQNTSRLAGPPMTPGLPTLDYNSFNLNDNTWPLIENGEPTMIMDLAEGNAPFSSNTQHLEFANMENLSGLDISFDAVPSQNGRIRVRIHPPAPTLIRSSSPDSSTPPSLWSGSDSASNFGESLPGSELFTATTTSPSSPSSIPACDPFLGVGTLETDFTPDISFVSTPSTCGLSASQFPFAPFASDSSAAHAGGGAQRRVKIALKSFPTTGGEGGEWEIQIV